MAVVRAVWFSFHLGCHRSAASLSLKCFSSDSDNCPGVGIGPLLQFPHPLRAGPVLLTLLFPPSSFVLLRFAWVYIFFSAGQVLLSTLSWCSACTSVSWCIRGERCIPCPPTPPPSCSSYVLHFISLISGKDFPGGSGSKVSAYNVEDLGLIPGLGRSSGEGRGNPLQYSCLENPMDGGAW